MKTAISLKLCSFALLSDNFVNIYLVAASLVWHLIFTSFVEWKPSVTLINVLPCRTDFLKNWFLSYIIHARKKLNSGICNTNLYAKFWGKNCYELFRVALEISMVQFELNIAIYLGCALILVATLVTLVTLFWFWAQIRRKCCEHGSYNLAMLPWNWRTRSLLLLHSFRSKINTRRFSNLINVITT